MTKLEFLDRINDILIGLNTAESDALGSLYDELMRDAGWHPASELPQLDENESSDLVYALGKVFSKEFGEYIDKVPCRVRVIHGKWAPEDIEVKWWCYPPKEE